MDERRTGPPPARELPLWKRLGRALTRAVWPIAGAKNDPWLADDAASTRTWRTRSTSRMPARRTEPPAGEEPAPSRRAPEA